MRKFMIMFRLCVILYFAASVLDNTSVLAELVGFWTFDDPISGIIDVSGQNNDAQVVGGASFTTDGVLGAGGLLLNGTDSYTKLFTWGNFNGDFTSGEATLSMWVKLNEQAGLNVGLASVGVWAYPSFYPASSAGAMSLKLFLSDGEPVVVNFPPSYNKHQWNHIAVTVDAADVDAGYKVYLNGQLAGWYPMDGTHGNFLPPLTPRIGLSYDISTNTSYYFCGTIDEVKIYNEALTALQVNAIVNFADFNADGTVDYRDLIIIAENWQKSTIAPDWGGGSDFDRNGIVDASDLAVFAAQWLN